jgi:hypothetical protein
MHGGKGNLDPVDGKQRLQRDRQTHIGQGSKGGREQKRRGQHNWGSGCLMGKGGRAGGVG